MAESEGISAADKVVAVVTRPLESTVTLVNVPVDTPVLASVKLMATPPVPDASPLIVIC